MPSPTIIATILTMGLAATSQAEPLEILVNPRATEAAQPSQSASAKALPTECPNFTGEWSGICTTQDGSSRQHELSIRQKVCHRFELDSLPAHDMEKLNTMQLNSPGATGVISFATEWDEAVQSVTLIIHQFHYSEKQPFPPDSLSVTYISNVKLALAGDTLLVDTKRFFVQNYLGEFVGGKIPGPTCRMIKQSPRQTANVTNPG